MIYLDNNATTRPDPEVREAMLPWLGESYGNPSAGYRFGRAAREALGRAREQVAALLGAADDEIVFTSGGTEAINTALRSALSAGPAGGALVTSATEHSAVYELAVELQEDGREVRFTPVDAAGRLDLERWRDNLAADGAAAASLIWANNETGVLGPVEEAAALCAERGIFLHLDAVQAVGKIPVRTADLPAQALSVSAHKLHGPKGVGALWLHRNVRFRPLLRGGGQEEGRRSGTENVAGIVGLGVAAELAAQRLAEAPRLAALRDAFETAVLESVPGAEVNGDPSRRLPNTSNIHFPGVDGEGLLILLDEAGVCCSPGSACSTGSVKPSRILRSMGHSAARARSSVRFSFSRFNTEAEAGSAAAAVRAAVEKLRVVMPSGGSRVVRNV